MDSIEIIYLLHRIGKSQAQLARELGVSSGVVNNVIHDRISAHTIATHIALLIGYEVGEIWPSRYAFKPRGVAANRGKAKPSRRDKGGGIT